MAVAYRNIHRFPSVIFMVVECSAFRQRLHRIELRRAACWHHAKEQPGDECGRQRGNYPISPLSESISVIGCLGDAINP